MKPEVRLNIQLDGTFDVYALEQKLANYYGKKHCLLTSSATMAIYAISIACSLKEKHIIVPSFGWSGSIAPFLHFGNKLSFAGVDDRFCISPDKIQELITPATKAIFSIDTGGNACDSLAISNIAKANGLLYISDSAESVGAIRDNMPAGSFADCIVLSGTSGKTLNAGEMGAILTDDRILYEKLLLLSQHPHRQKKELGSSNWNPFTPLNCRVNPLAAIKANQAFDMLHSIVKNQQTTAIGIIMQLSSDNIVSCFSFKPEESTFFEYYGYSSIDNIGRIYDKCEATSIWYISESLSQMNLLELTKKHFPKLVSNKRPITNDYLKNLVKVQFNFELK
ncbi:MAG: aminotransferase class V-fold PLP-dependent enzyme [Sphingobacteriales bacterium]|nr:MAG: aminotransferase class V-fold PLP-dependent enzyme [Sphingobacteriales bacterium]